VSEPTFGKALVQTIEFPEVRRADDPTTEVDEQLAEALAVSGRVR
jgi:hypothetical protein